METSACTVGCSDAEGVVAMMGHRSPSSFTRYSRQADRVRLSDAAAAAAVTRLRERMENEKRKAGRQKSAKVAASTEESQDKIPTLQGPAMVPPPRFERGTSRSTI